MTDKPTTPDAVEGEGGEAGETASPSTEAPKLIKGRPGRVKGGIRMRLDGQPDKRYGKPVGGAKRGRKPKGAVATKPGQRVKRAEDRKQAVHLSPIQLRVLDLYFDPTHFSIEDVARAAGIHSRTIRHWLATHPKFVDEWRSRALRVTDGLVDATVRAALIALDTLVKIAQSEKQPVEARIKAAESILKATHGFKLQVDVLANHRHVHAHAMFAGPGGAQPAEAAPAPAPTVEAAPTPPPAMQRLLMTGEDTLSAARVEARELIVMVEQIGHGALMTADAIQDDPGPATGWVEGQAT